MKRILTALLLFGSTQAMAVGPEFEQGVDSPKTLSCTPATARTDGVPLDSATEPASTVIKTTNVDTGVTETATAAKDCNRVYNLDAMQTGQYEIAVSSVDTDGREGPDSEVYSFLLIKTVQPPNAPTGITLQ